MLNFALQRWMMSNPFNNNGFSKEKKARMNEDLSFPVVSVAISKKTNQDLSFPIADYATAKKENEISEQNHLTENQTPGAFLMAAEKTEQVEDSSFLVAFVAKRAEAPLQQVPEENQAPEVFYNGFTTEKTEQVEDSSFLVASVAKKAEAPLQQVPEENQAPEVFFNGFTAERTDQAEDSSFPVAAYATAYKEDETSEQQIPTESVGFEESIPGDRFEERIDFLSSHAEQSSFSKSEENESLYTLAPEGKSDFQEDDKTDQFDAINLEELSSVESKEVLVDIQEEISRAETISDEKSYARIPYLTEKEEKPTPSQEDEIIRAREEKKARANAFTEEYMKSREMISEQSRKMRKKQLVMIGISFVSLFVFTVATVLYFFAGATDTLNGTRPPIIVSNNSDNNSSGLVVSDAISNGANKLVSNDDSGFKNALNTIIGSFLDQSVQETISDDESNKLPGLVTSLVEQSNQGASSADSSSASEDNIDTIVAQNIASSESVGLETIVIDNIVNKEESIQKSAPSGAAQTSAETGKTTGSTRAVQSEIKRTTVNTARNERKPATRTVRQNTGTSARTTRTHSPAAIDLTQDRIFSAIKDERYDEAIDLSKRNLERNSKDRLSFFSLGVAFYASSDFYGATRAFYACLNIDGPGLPEFLVEEFDSAESLESLFINYPGVDLLIRSVELNPQDKSLYLNLLLSNLKSEKPMETSEVYNAVLNHAQKRGLNVTKLN